MVAARKTANILAVHLLRDVAAQQHRCDQANLVNVIALLPSSLPAPRNLIRRVEWIECIGGYAAVTHLMRRNSKVAQLQLFVFTDEHIEWSEIAMQRLSAVQCIERLKDCSNLAPHKSL